MGKIVSDPSGDLRKAVFYRFTVWCGDEVLLGKPTPEWIVAPRVPTNDALVDADQPSYLALQDEPRAEDCVETKDCTANPNHATLCHYKALRADLVHGPRLSPIVPTLSMRFFAVSDDFRARLGVLKVKGARFDLITIGDNPYDLKDVKIWNFQFIGRARLRPPKFVDTPNHCPHCGVGMIVCESCGKWIPLCENCGKEMYVIDYKHKGSSDKRIPFQSDLNRVIEGKTWDGSDLVQTHLGDFASKRFIDWLLRVHAAPFYAEPVWFCVDGMSDQQKRWFDDLQKPFEA